MDGTKAKYLLSLLLLSACATLSEEEKIERAMALAEARDNYEVTATACNKAGGHMVIDRNPGLVERTIRDYKHAYCAK